MTQALNDAGFPEDHLPSRSAADFLTGPRAAIGWKAQLTRDELNAAMAILFLRTVYADGRPGGLLLMWHPTTRWLYVRSTGPRKAAQPDFHRWIDRKLIDAVTRFARLRGLAYAQQKVTGNDKCTSRAKRSDNLPPANPIYFPRIVVLSDWLRNDGYEPNFSDWGFDPQILPTDVHGDQSSYIFDFAQLPTSGDPHTFIRHMVDGYNFVDFLFTIKKRGRQYIALTPQPSVPKRLGIVGHKGRRWRNLLRMPVFGEGKSERGPFESSRRKLYQPR